MSNIDYLLDLFNKDNEEMKKDKVFFVLHLTKKILNKHKECFGTRITKEMKQMVRDISELHFKLAILTSIEASKEGIAEKYNKDLSEVDNAPRVKIYEKIVKKAMESEYYIPFE